MAGCFQVFAFKELMASAEDPAGGSGGLWRVVSSRLAMGTYNTGAGSHPNLNPRPSPWPQVSCLAAGTDDVEGPLPARPDPPRHELLGRDAKGTVAEVVYSPDGHVLALSSWDNSVYLYSVANGYKL